MSEITTLECLLLWLQYSHCEEHQELMKAIRKKEREINQLEKSMENAIRTDYGSIKQIVDEHYARNEREESQNRLINVIHNLHNKGYTVKEIAEITCTEIKKVENILKV